MKDMIFYGKRGSGKTYSLMKQAKALLQIGITPIFIVSSASKIDNLKWAAIGNGIDVKKCFFKTYSNIKDKEIDSSALRDSCNYRIMIDDVDAFLHEVLHCDIPISASINFNDVLFEEVSTSWKI